MVFAMENTISMHILSTMRASTPNRWLYLISGRLPLNGRTKWATESTATWEYLNIHEAPGQTRMQHVGATSCNIVARSCVRLATMLHIPMHVAFFWPTLLNMLQHDPTILHATCCIRLAWAWNISQQINRKSLHSLKPGFHMIASIVPIPIARQKVGRRSGRSLWSEVFPYDRKDRFDRQSRRDHSQMSLINWSLAPAVLRIYLRIYQRCFRIAPIVRDSFH